MREAIGATWITGIVIVFVALFSGYLAFSVNYSKAFSLKNGVVERIEKYNGFNYETYKSINDYIDTIKYGAKGDCSKAIVGATDSSNAYTTDITGIAYIGCIKNDTCDSTSGCSACSTNSFTDSNFCIQKVSTRATTDQLTSAYYKVYVFYTFNIGVIDLSSLLCVTGETKSLAYPADIPILTYQ